MLVLLQPQHDHQYLLSQLVLWPDIVRCKNAVFLYRQAIENRFNIFGINILPARSDDHVSLSPEKLQMSAAIKTAEIARQKPTFDDSLQREVRVVEVMGHDRIAAS